MNRIWAVYKRELRLFFRSPIAYGVAFAVIFFISMLFNDYVNRANGQGIAQSAGIAGVLTSLLFLAGPLLTMRLLAEESREGTLEVLMTLPLSEWHFIVGKFLAAWTYYTALLGITLIYHAIFKAIGVPDDGAVFAAYLGAWLYGGAVLAITMIWSAITEDQIVAAFLGAATVLVLTLAESASSWIATQPGLANMADFIRELSLEAHYSATMMQGIIRAEDVLYFVFLMVGALFITTRIVETRRWRS